MSGLTPPNPLSYEGQVAVTFINKPFPPTSSFINFNVPTIWTDTAAEEAYLLVSKVNGVADWANLTSSENSIDTITTPDATVVAPTANNINFLNGTGMSITGSGSNITFSSTITQGIVTLNGNTGSCTGTAVTINGGTTGLTTTASSSTMSLTGTLVVANGGTGAASLTSHGVLYGNGTSAIGATSEGTTGTLLIGVTGNAPSFSASCPGDFSFTNSTSGVNRSLLVSNSDNSGGGHSVFWASTGGTGGGDPYLNVAISTIRSYGFGIDNSSSNRSLSISTAANGNVSPSSGTKIWNMSSGGTRTMPLQPCLLATLVNPVINTTGDGTLYTIILDSKVYDQASNYNTANGVFTAGVTGRYRVIGCLAINGITSSHTTGLITIAATSRNFQAFRANPFNMASTTALDMPFACDIDMSAGDTFTVVLQISGGTKVITVEGSGSTAAYAYMGVSLMY